MSNDTKTANEAAAYQLGWLAYKRGDVESLPTADNAFIALRMDGGANVGALIRAYNCGFNDALRKAISS